VLPGSLLRMHLVHARTVKETGCRLGGDINLYRSSKPACRRLDVTADPPPAPTSACPTLTCGPTIHGICSNNTDRALSLPVATWVAYPSGHVPWRSCRPACRRSQGPLPLPRCRCCCMSVHSSTWTSRTSCGGCGFWGRLRLGLRLCMLRTHVHGWAVTPRSGRTGM
jgi:hypothetical protein